MNIFNYFGELKKQFNLPETVLNSYNIVNIGGHFVYVEGHLGLLTLSTEKISFKIKKGIVEVKGNEMFLKELTENTLAIQGKIYKIEVF